MSLLAEVCAGDLDGSRPAIEFGGVVLTRRELSARAGQFAAALVGLGMHREDRVGLVMANPAVFLTSVLGAACAGVTVGALRPRWFEEGAGGPLAAWRPSLLVHDYKRPAWLPPQLQYRVLAAREIFVDRPADDPGHHLRFCPVDHRPWLLSMSSGTTGEPKCVVTSQAAFEASLRMGEQFCRVDRVMLFVDPTMYWSVASAMRVIRAGATAVFQPPDVLPQRLLEILQRSRVNVLVLSADAASKIANFLLDFPERAVPVRLARVIVGGGRVSKRVRELLNQHWGAEVVVLYGSTEMGPMASWRGTGAAGEGDDALTPYPGVDIQVIDAREAALPAGETGLLRLRSAALFSGYLDERGDMPGKMPEWFVPGDLGRLLPDGCLELQGRADHVLNLGGFKLHPERVEEVIGAYPGVLDVAVTLTTLGEAKVEVLVALVVLKPGASLDAARVHGQDRLVPSMQPMFWLAVNTLPRNAAGKLLRTQLAQMVSAEPTRLANV